MSIAKLSLGEAALGQSEPTVVKPKTPPKRQYVARSDMINVPEPR